MRTVDLIPIILDTAEVARRIRFDPTHSGFDSIGGLVSTAQPLIEPRAIFETGYVGRVGENIVEIAGITFVSPVLRKNLETVKKVFPYIITVGPGLERAAHAQSDLLKQYYLEEIANFALEQAAAWLARYLETRFGVIGLASLSPGSLVDWPITEQPKLFSILGDTERLIGVKLTDSMLMIPRKSISGIYFPSEEGFIACQLCERENCSGRKAPFKRDHYT